jgi:hypothetical protein
LRMKSLGQRKVKANLCRTSGAREVATQGRVGRDFDSSPETEIEARK